MWVLVSYKIAYDLHTQLVIMLKHCFFLIKNEYYFQFVSNPSNYTVKSNFVFRHGPFAFPGKGEGVDGWDDMHRFSFR